MISECINYGIILASIGLLCGGFGGWLAFVGVSNEEEDVRERKLQLILGMCLVLSGIAFAARGAYYTFCPYMALGKEVSSEKTE